MGFLGFFFKGRDGGEVWVDGTEGGGLIGAVGVGGEVEDGGAAEEDEI